MILRLVCVVPCLVLAGIVSSYAVHASEVPGADVRERMQETRERYDAEAGRPEQSFRERVAERRKLFAAGVKERLANLLENVTKRHTAIADRFDQIVTRIDTRISLLKNEGRNTAAAEASLERARTEIAASRATIEPLTDTTIESLVDDALPRDRFAELRKKIETSREHLRNAQDALRETVSLLGTANAANNTDTATTTPTE